MKNKPSLLFLIAFAFLFVCIASSCKKKVIHKNIICYIDFSVNPNWEKRVNYYADIVNTSILENMSFNDRIVILPIDNGTLTNSQELLNNSFKKRFDYIPNGTSPLQENEVSQQNLNKDKKTMIATFNTNLANAKSMRANLTMGTDIIGALKGVSKYYQDGQQNIVILLSDMMNWSDNLKMEEGSFTTKSAETQLSSIQSIDGKGARVIVHTGDLTNISSKHFSLVNEFWKKYFDKNNFLLFDYSSGAKSKLEELITSGN